MALFDALAHVMNGSRNRDMRLADQNQAYLDSLRELVDRYGNMPIQQLPEPYVSDRPYGQRTWGTGPMPGETLTINGAELTFGRDENSYFTTPDFISLLTAQRGDAANCDRSSGPDGYAQYGGSLYTTIPRQFRNTCTVSLAKKDVIQSIKELFTFRVVINERPMEINFLETRSSIDVVGSSAGNPGVLLAITYDIKVKAGSLLIKGPIEGYTSEQRQSGRDANFNIMCP